MTREEKTQEIKELSQRIEGVDNLYITDASELTAEQETKLRRMCFEQGIEMRVAKNTLVKKAMEQSEKDFEGLYDILKGPTSILFSENANAPAKVIQKFRKGADKPVLKAAYIDTEIYLGDEQVQALVELKSREELIGEIVGLLQSPIKNVISALQSGGQTITGVLKTLSERAED